MAKKLTGLLIGRFQPLHKGHVYLIREALKTADTIIIAIGSSNVANEKNPYSFQLRKKMLEAVITAEKLDKKKITIISLPDFPDDDIWLKKTLRKTGPIDIVFGNNEWVNGIFEKAGYKVVRVPYFKRHLYEGEKIRNLIRNGKRWKQRIPLYLSNLFS